MIGLECEEKIKKMIKYIKWLFVCILFVAPVYEVASYDEEDDEIFIDEKKEQKNEERQKKNQMRIWVKKLNSIKKKGKEIAILALTTKILNQDPNNIDALSSLGVHYMRREKNQLAKIIFTRALKKHPKNSSLHSNLAVIALKEGKQEEAIAAFQKSLEYRYSNYAAASTMGTLYLQAYEVNSALDYLDLGYNRAKEYLSMSDYETVKTGNNYAVALSWSGDFRKSREIFEKLIAKNPGSVELLVNYAILLGKDLKEKQESLKVLQKADLKDRTGRYADKIKALRRYLTKKDRMKKEKGI